MAPIRRPVSLAVMLVSMLALAVGHTTLTAAEASTRTYDAAVDVTFPVAGHEYRYIDDYHQCRGGSGCPRIHRATDVMARYGTPVHAAVGGTVSYITGLDSALPVYGYMVTIRGDDGRSYSYIHLGRQDGPPSEAYVAGLATGSRVERGQRIGFVGCSGNASCTAPHLHFEISDPNVLDPYDTNRVNPFASLRSAEHRNDHPLTFRDVGWQHVHLTTIESVAEAGITRGCNPPTNDMFCPEQPVTRGQMAAFLARARHLDSPGTTRFRDVPADHVFARDIARLAEAGITRGCNPPANDRYCPDAPVTREQMAAFLGRAFGLPPSEAASFVDVPAGSTFTADIDRLAGAGVTRGCNPPSNDRFCPTGEVTRAQMASFLDRALRR